MTPLPGRGATGGTLLDRWEALGRPFAHLPRWAAALVLALLAAAMAWSVYATAPVDSAERARSDQVEAAPAHDKGSGDLALYTRIADRMAAGEGYYPATIDEHRTSNYPTRPFVAVRQPTLAWLQAVIGVGGVRYAMMGLVLACLWALNARLAGVVSLPERAAALILMMLGGAAVSVPLAGLIHELWSGLWLTLALLLYRPERWWPALIAAAAAIAVRELAVPFVLLWLAFALVTRRWREAAAVAGLLALFALGMGLHWSAIESLRQPGDPASQGWSDLVGYALPLMALARLTGLLLLPLHIASPVAILPLIGWLGLGGRIGLFAALWFAGLATMMALFARPENFYWAQLGLPAYGIGLAFVPRALAEVTGRLARQT
jgi:MFS family permease